MSEIKQFALTRPAYVGQAHLVVHDLPRVSDFYQKIIGLSVLEKNPSGEVLGVNGQPLLTLSTSDTAERAPRNAAGLFHTAFLMPSRNDLAHWLAHAAHHNIQLQGASDHLVSEAIYLADPEGNGIEVYRDRSPDEWSYQPDGTVEMATTAPRRRPLPVRLMAPPSATFICRSAIFHRRMSFIRMCWGLRSWRGIRVRASSARGPITIMSPPISGTAAVPRPARAT
ncbi:Catechol-2,3-dioxygenase [Agrobacterium fabrum]|nr:Catechol-2,3-dioxygenase [Agrobacterium fabrum]CAH0267979.1 Catechol-2,3-dioxygenase [Agrobacterium fabrum]